MINAVIIEDETIHFDNILDKLHKYTPEVKVIAKIDSGAKAIEILPTLSFDLLFLDIELGDMTAFDLLEKIDTGNFRIIFVTAYDKYAVKAFHTNAVDYLLKPVDGEEVKNAVEKAVNSNLSPETKNNLITDYHLNKSDTLTISDNNSYTFIPVSSINYCKSKGNYTEIYYNETGNETVVIATKNLSYFEDKLKSFRFVRIHQSHIINGNKVKKIKKSNRELILLDGTKLEIARNRKKEVIERLTEGRL